MDCPNCGTKNKDSAKYCSKCGTPLGNLPIESFTQAVALARAGEERGFSYLYEETYKSKYYLALKYMDQKEPAEDVLQDSYIKAFSKLDTLKDPETFSGWLGTIVANTAKNALQKNNPILFSDLTDETDEGEELDLQIEDESIEAQPEEAYLQQENTELLAEMLGSLSEEQRMCILMYHIEGESIREIAEALDCSENTVKSRLNYGRKNLRAKAEELKKKGYKVAGTASIPLLLTLLGNDAYAMSADPAFLAAGKQMEAAILRQIPSLVQSAAQAGAGTAAEAGSHAAAGNGTQTAAGTGAKAAAGAARHGFLSTTAGKVILTVIIAAVVVGGVAGGLVYRNNQVKQEEARAGEDATTEGVEWTEEETASEEEAAEEEEEATQLTDDMYPELLEGGLTREQFEIALAYAPEEVENDEISVDDLLTIVSSICYDYGDICFNGTMVDSTEGFRHYNSGLTDVNRFLSVLSGYSLSAGDSQPDDVEISGDTVSVTIYDGEWMTPSATITHAVLAEDTITVTYNVRGSGTGGYYPESTGTRTAELKPTESGKYRVDRIFPGTVEEHYQTERQELLVLDEGDWQREAIYYDLVSLEDKDEAHRAVNDGLYADYQAFLAYNERITGKTMEAITAMGDSAGFYQVGAGVTYIENGILSVRFNHLLMGDEENIRQYGLTYSLETGEQLRVTDLTDLSDEELLSGIRDALRDYITDSTLANQSELIRKTSAYTLDDIGSGIDFLSTGKVSFCVDAGELVILIPPGEFTDDQWTSWAVPTGIYVSGAEPDAQSASSASNEDYIFPDSSSEYLTREDLDGLSSDELRLARNEIYARHGRKFDDTQLQNYFNGKDWYEGTIDPDDFKESMLNDYEKKNVELIQSMEDSSSQTSSDSASANTGSGFSFADISNMDFVHSSGAGAWGEGFIVHSDGTFEGSYHDEDAYGSYIDDNGNELYATVTSSEWTGTFSTPVKVNDYTYTTKVESITLTRETGSEIKDHVLYKYTPAEGMSVGDEFTIYLPSTQISDLPDWFMSAVSANYRTSGSQLGKYGMINTTESTAFIQGG